MRNIVSVVVLLQACKLGSSEIKDSKILNKIKPVGEHLPKVFIPLTEIPPPNGPHVHKDGRRHMEDCSEVPPDRYVYEGAKVGIFGEYYDDRVIKKVATVIIPDHIDRRHFEVTTQVPYLTVGTIPALGFHPTTSKANECDKIYQDHIEANYGSMETSEHSEESLEMARMPLNDPSYSVEQRLREMYEDI